MSGTHSSEVQAYLDKHKITKLFEDLLSKLVNELPSNPVDFLVSKLQAFSSRKKVGQRAATSGTKSKLQVSGSSLSPRPKSSTHGATKPFSLHTPRGQASVSRSPGSSSKLARPSSSSSSIPKPGMRMTPRTPGSQLKPLSTTPTRPSTAPSKKGTPKANSGLSPGVRLSSGSKAQPKSRAGIPAAKSGSTALKSRRPTEAIPAERSKVSKSPSIPVATVAKGKVKKPSSARPPVTVEPASKAETKEIPQLLEYFDEDEEERGGKREQEDWSEEEGEGEGEGESGEDGRKDLAVEDVIKLRESSSHSKQRFIDSLLAPPTSTETTPSSEGYWSEDGEEEEGVEVMEDYAALEEEGVDVSVLKKSKFTTREAPPIQEQATVDLRLQICSRCARVLTNERDSGATETASVVTATEADFESASQVGSHASFPQWTGSAVSSTRLGQSDTSEVMSDVTLQSHDTWGGIAPQPRVELPPSDVESEVQLPPAPPLEGQPWTTTDTPQDHFGWAQ